MGRLRISIVEFLNTAPLVWGFTDGPLRGKYDLSFTVPSLCAEALRSGEADVAIIPAIEYQRMGLPGEYLVLPNIAVAAKGAVRSILVLSKVPIEKVQRLALDSSSRSSAAMVRLLCEGQWKIAPEFVDARPDPAEMLRAADAALLIGDPALRVTLKTEALGTKQPSGEYCCRGDPAELPVPGFDTLFLYDVAHQWRQWTGLPCVLAFWAARREAVTPEVIADFNASKAYGVARVVEIGELAEARLGLPSKDITRYLGEHIDYSLDDANRAGLELYYQKAAAAGLIPRLKPVEYARA